MAWCPAEKSYGNESSRSEKYVYEHFHCSICNNVLKEPRMCRNNKHIFCLGCITEHLTVNSQTCPGCNHYLSVDTLRRPRVFKIKEFRIKCEHARRGCPEVFRVADLETHVENCGFAPVLCSNQECGMEINKQDKVHHETEVCEYRKVNFFDFIQIRTTVQKLEKNSLQLDGKVEEGIAHTKHNHTEIKTIVRKMEGSLVGINKRINKKVGELKNSDYEMKRDQQKVTKEVREVKKEVKDAKENLSKVTKDVYQVKFIMSQMLEKLNMLQRLNKLPSPSEEMMNAPREEILIAGGSASLTKVEKSTEIYSWEKNGWFQISEMNKEHEYASSVIYKDHLFVIGGVECKTIETLDLNELSMKWMKFAYELPYACLDHQTVAYQQRVIHIGGMNDEEKEVSNVISEMQLSPPCIVVELCQMPEPRGCHGAEIFEDKVLIIGGANASDDYEYHNDENDNDDKDCKLVALDSVLEFDINQLACKEMQPLPYPLAEMATVRWRDEVIVIGGEDKDDKALNDVFMYNCKTGKITTLPSMLEKRCGCCAVITGNTIVVMGGKNEEDDFLDSVECFTMGGSTWEYLPAMNKARYYATAHVLPSTRKYV